MDDIVQGADILADPQREREAAPIRKIGIIGAGQMGSGIAHVVALSGYDVTINDLAKERFEAAIQAIDKNMSRQVASGKINEDERKAALARIKFAESMQDLGDADLVIEAATEEETVKRKIFVALCPFLKPDAIVGTNTSSISITRLGATTDRPERFIGLHFMNPAPVMELVEMIRGIATDDETFGRAKEFIESLGKTTAVSEDFPAFMVNRILLPMINEAVYTL
ncbi:MAG: 3-hydroxyacyl-CoA dehydrogenase NAD-binding domain-containing protein, partial [Methyloceanibacter sp.]